MTVTYSLAVSTQNSYNFYKLLFTWKGSVWQCIYRELAVWSLLYTMLSCIYRFALSTDQRKTFETVALWCERYSNYVPVTFVLGFYVNLVISRWWDHLMNIPWPDEVAYSAACHLRGSDDQSRQMRRTLVRWLVLAEVIVFRNISTAVKKRFPTLEHLVEAGLMTEREFKAYEKICTSHYKHFIPLRWCYKLLTRAHLQGRITDVTLKMFFEQINKYKLGLAILVCYDWVSVPLVYTQVTHIGVRSFFIVCLMGRQYLHPSVYTEPEHDLYVPIFSILQFIFYVGWIKVAEVGINPFGEDDDDFELNWIIDRNLQIGYTIVDEDDDVVPEVEKDLHWDDPEIVIPYTEASAGLMDASNNPGIGSCAQITVSPEQATLMSSSPPACKELQEKLSPKIASRKINSVPTSPSLSLRSLRSSIRNRFKRQQLHNLGTISKIGPPPLERRNSDSITSYLKSKLKRSRLVRMLSTESDTSEVSRPPVVTRNQSFGSKSSISTVSHLTDWETVTVDMQNLEQITENIANLSESQNDYQPTLASVPEEDEYNRKKS